MGLGFSGINGSPVVFFGAWAVCVMTLLLKVESRVPSLLTPPSRPKIEHVIIWVVL